MGNQSIQREANSLQPSALLTFFILDATALGGGILRLTPHNRDGGTGITWQGVLYSTYPVEFLGNEFKGQGTLPRPTMRMANVLGTISALIIAYGNLVGAAVIRKRTFARFLDGQPEADPAAALPDEVFEIDRLAYEDRNYVEFELASTLEVEGVMLPRRQVMAASCYWRYRSPECGFAENVAVATKDDVNLTPYNTQVFRGEWSVGTTYAARDVVWRQLTPDIKRFYMAKGATTGNRPPDDAHWSEDLCSLTLRGCARRFGPGKPRPDPKPFGGFPGVHKVMGG